MSPEAMSNMFDVYFVVKGEQGDSFLAPSKNVYIDSLMYSQILAARIEEIEVPPLTIETQDVSFAGTSLTKGKSTFNTKMSSNISIRGDTNLYYVDIFNELSKTSLGSMFRKDELIQGAIAGSGVNLSSVQHSLERKAFEKPQDIPAFKYITSAIFNNTTFRLTGKASLNNLREGLRLDIIVKRKVLDKYFKTTPSFKKDERFVFEDVRFLGTSDDIKFTRDSPNTQVFNYEFIFKRVYKVDMLADTETYIEEMMEKWFMRQSNETKAPSLNR